MGNSGLNLGNILNIVFGIFGGMAALGNLVVAICQLRDSDSSTRKELGSGGSIGQEVESHNQSDGFENFFCRKQDQATE
jgi:hypothetical protein